MNTLQLNPMEVDEDLDAFLLEEQVIMNHHHQQQQQQQQINEVPQQQVLMNSATTRAEDIISWFDTDEDDDVPMHSFLAADNLQMHNHHQLDQPLFLDTFDQPDVVVDNHFHESPFLLDLLCNINEFDSFHLSHDNKPSSSSCSSPPLVEQNLFFDDPDMSEFMLINNVNTNISTTQNHMNEVHCNVSTTMDKLSVDATNEVTNYDENSNNENKDGDEDEDDNPKATSPLVLASASGVAPCKNLVSERNRRKRMSQQLLALRSLVPNITKMDKRSVLVDALAYLRNLHEETDKLQNELNQQPAAASPQSNNTMTCSATIAAVNATCIADNLSETEDNLCIPLMLEPRTKSRAIITEIDTERIENQRFVVKITCKVKDGNSSSSSTGVGGDVLRVMESLGYDITYANTTTTLPIYQQRSKQQNQQLLLTTLFIRVRNNKEDGKMTEEKLRECISNRALKCGLTFQKHPLPPTVPFSL